MENRVKVLPLSKFDYSLANLSQKVLRPKTVKETVPEETDEEGNVVVPAREEATTVNEWVEEYLPGVIEITEEDLAAIDGRTHCFSDDLKSVRPLNYAEANEEAEKKRAREKEFETARLRGRRDAECYSVINRGEMWHQRLTYRQKQELSAWYQAWLDVTDTGVVPVKPEWV